jgi:flagellar hook-associated protein 3 FlgL
MSLSPISTKALQEGTRMTVLRLQRDLAVAQKEVASGRLADVGASLGARTAETVSLRQEFARLETIAVTNASAGARLEVTQQTLSNISTAAQGFASALLAARESQTGPRLAQGEARANLVSLIDSLNTSFAGGQLFSGVNLENTPVARYYGTPTSPARQAVADAFQAAFGFPQTNPQVATLAGAPLESFLENDFAALFDDAAWKANWSTASDDNIQSRIAVSDVIETSTNANEPVFRKLAEAYTMVADLGVEGMNREGFSTIVDRALSLTTEAVQELAALQGALGSAQARIAQSTTRIEAQIDVITTRINGLESVDPFEAATRVNSLLTQIETAYALTARIQRLSLLNYL